jgi:hypothetical protein
MSAAAQPLPPGVSFEDAQKISQGDMAAIGAFVTRYKLTHIPLLQPEFISFFVDLEDAWLVLRQAMRDAKIPIRDIDKKVKEKRDGDKPPPFDPSTIDDANSYGSFTMTKDGLFKAQKKDLIRVCVAFEVLGISAERRIRTNPSLDRRAGGFLFSSETATVTG